MLMIGERYAPFASLCCLMLHKQTFCKIEPFDEIDECVPVLECLAVHFRLYMVKKDARRIVYE